MYNLLINKLILDNIIFNLIIKYILFIYYLKD